MECLAWMFDCSSLAVLASFVVGGGDDDDDDDDMHFNA